MTMRLLIFAGILMMLVAGCTTTGTEGETVKTIHLTDVRVTLPKENDLAESFPDRFRSVLLHFAQVYNTRQSGRIEGYRLEVLVKRVHYKNALATLLVGDANSMLVEARVVDPEDDSVLRLFEVGTVDTASALLNGISGALLSAGVAKTAADQTMFLNIAEPIMTRAFVSNPLPDHVRAAVKKRDLLTPPAQPISPLSSPVTPETAEKDEESAIPAEGENS